MKIRENFPTYKEVILFLIGLSSQFVSSNGKSAHRIGSVRPLLSNM